MIIVGIDPGTRITGYGIISLDKGGLSLIDYGCIKPPPNALLSDRYLILYDSLTALLERHTPSHLAVETQFVAKNPQSAIKLGMARATIVLAAKKRGMQVFEYAPTSAKKAVGGKSKEQVSKMVGLLLKVESIASLDASDALSIAVAHANALRYQNTLSKEI